MEGDIVQLTVDGESISTGYVDSTSIDTDDNGSRVSIYGRDLMGMLEDNDAVNPDSSIMWANVATLDEVLPKLLKDTRIRGFEKRNLDSVKSLFATNPGESRLAALQRFLDPLNAIAWMSSGGKIVCGKPSFDAGASGSLGIRMIGDRRFSNVLSMRVARASAQIPNAILSIWTGNETTQTVSMKQLKQNTAEGPARLYKAGHKIFRTMVTSAPDANDTKSGLTEIQRIISQGAKYLDSLAARELARENIAELIVTAVVPGHLNASGDPYAADQTYNVVHDAAGVEKKMYLSGVEYGLTEDAGQITTLTFINLNTIVAEGPVAPPATSVDLPDRGGA